MSATSSDPPVRVRRMASDAASLARSGISVREAENVDGPSPGSRALEWHESASDDRDREHFTHGMILSVQQLMVAEQSLLGVAALSTALPEQLLGIPPLARAAMEASAQARWLSGADSGTVFVARFRGLGSAAARNAEKWAAQIGFEDDDPMVVGLRGNEAQFTAPGADVSGSPKRTVLVGELLREIGLGERGLGVAYGWMSSIAHGEKLGIDQVIGEPIWRSSEVQVPEIGAMEWMIWAAAMCYGWAACTTYELLGWDHDGWRAAVLHWTERLQATLEWVRAERGYGGGPTKA